jgi:hypothetical protein
MPRRIHAAPSKNTKPDYMAVYTDRDGAETAVREDFADAARYRITKRGVRAFGDVVIVFVLAVWRKEPGNA